MEYGSPSGHSLESIGFALYAALDLSSPEFGCNKKILILASFIYSFVVAAKRAFTIAHSFD
jgi:membrane-associated phospholipid phosphatase